ncbi:hypothetical protein B9Z55_008538 [Caenorhabditis nigoni]|nr:hypothetical protein B9Z55_008538 [Caenorhabditis nigoni]
MIWNELVARKLLSYYPRLTEQSIQIKENGFEIRISFVNETTNISEVGHMMCAVAYLVDNPLPFGKTVEIGTKTNSSKEISEDPPMHGDTLKIRVEFSAENPPREVYRFKVMHKRKEKVNLLMEGASQMRLMDGDPSKPIPYINPVLPQAPIMATVGNQKDSDAPPAKKAALMLATDSEASSRIGLHLIWRQPYQKFMFVGVGEIKPYQKMKLYSRLNEMGAHARDICYVSLFFKNQNLYVYFFDGFAKGDDAKIGAALFKKEDWEKLFNLSNLQSGGGFFGKSISFAALFKHMLIATRRHNLSIFQKNRLQIVKKGEELKEALMDEGTLKMVKNELNEFGMGILEKIQGEANN